MSQFVKGRWGEKIYPGDRVKCIAYHYMTLDYGDHINVMDVDHNCVSLPNNRSSVGYTRYYAQNFQLVEKRNPAHFEPIRQANQPMSNYMHVAILKSHGAATVRQMVEVVNNEAPISILAAPDFETLKMLVQQDLQKNPDNVWVCGTMGNEIRIQAAPVTVRAW